MSQYLTLNIVGGVFLILGLVLRLASDFFKSEEHPGTIWKPKTWCSSKGYVWDAEDWFVGPGYDLYVYSTLLILLGGIFLMIDVMI